MLLKVSDTTPERRVDHGVSLLVVGLSGIRHVTVVPSPWSGTSLSLLPFVKRQLLSKKDEKND